MRGYNIAAALAIVLIQASSVSAQPRASAVVDDGYAGKALQKIMSNYSGNAADGQRMEAKLFLDGDGNYLDCRTLKGDTKALCQAAKSASPYGTPPYGVPTEIVIAVWGKQSVKTEKTDAADKSTAAHATGGQLDSKYLAKIRRQLRNAMYIPAETKAGTYHATVRLTLDNVGKILQSSIQKSSGDARLDKYVLQGIHRAGSVAVPPKGTPETFDITFTLVRN